MLLNILLAVHILVCISLIGVILLQRSEGGAFGMGGGGGGGFMSARGAGDLLTRTTAILATLFFILSLILTLLEGRNTGSSITQRLNINEAAGTPAAATPAPASTAPVAPLPTVGTTLPAAPQNAAPLAPSLGTQPADPLANLGGRASQPANR